MREEKYLKITETDNFNIVVFLHENSHFTYHSGVIRGCYSSIGYGEIESLVIDKTRFSII